MNRDVRLLPIARALIVSAVFAAPLSSLWLAGGVATGVKVVVGALVILSVLSPPSGAVALAALLPLALAGEVAFGAPPAAAVLTECMLYGFLAGAAIRLVPSSALDHGRTGPPVLALISTVVASAVVALAGQQAVQPLRPVAADLWQHVTTGYIVGERPFAEFHAALRWVGGLTLVFFVERTLRRWPAAGPVLVRVWLASGVVAASFALVRLGQIAFGGRLGPPVEALHYVFSTLRISALHGDLNAAGSYFVLLLVPAVLIGWRGRHLWLLAGVTPFVGVAFLLTKSRAAFGAFVLVMAIWWMGSVLRRRRFTQAAIAAAALVVLSGAFWAGTRQSNVSAQSALHIRADLVKVSLRMARERPLFGIGLEQYPRASRRFITDDLEALKQYAPAGENAHNNFLQILVELGGIALAAFLWLVLPVARPWRRDWDHSSTPVEAQGTAAGLVAFLVTALFGHPLLISQVLVAFFLALGIAAGLAPPPRGRGRLAEFVSSGTVAFVLAMIAWRLLR